MNVLTKYEVGTLQPRHGPASRALHLLISRSPELLKVPDYDPLVCFCRGVGLKSKWRQCADGRVGSRASHAGSHVALAHSTCVDGLNGFLNLGMCGSRPLVGLCQSKTCQNNVQHPPSCDGFGSGSLLRDAMFHAGSASGSYPVPLLG
jgi:hypothetical protein